MPKRSYLIRVLKGSDFVLTAKSAKGFFGFLSLTEAQRTLRVI